MVQNEALSHLEGVIKQQVEEIIKQHQKELDIIKHSHSVTSQMVEELERECQQYGQLLEGVKHEHSNSSAMMKTL